MCLTQYNEGPGLVGGAVEVEAGHGGSDGCVLKNVYSPNNATTFASGLASSMKYSVMNRVLG